MPIYKVMGHQQIKIKVMYIIIKQDLNSTLFNITAKCLEGAL